MRDINRLDFLNQSKKSLEAILSWLENLPVLDLNTLPADDTALVVVDMVNGFAGKGALMSPRIRNLIGEIAAISRKCDLLGVFKIAFADSHTADSPEFSSFPAHCLAGTDESEILNELKEIGTYTVIPKNSTNGFLEKGFQEWLQANTQKNTFIIVGDCTDICVLQFALTLKTWFNAQNRISRIIVPVNAVNTYNSENHNGDLTHVMGLLNMHTNGIEIVGGIA